jgi:uncharacterized protein YegL
MTSTKAETIKLKKITTDDLAEDAVKKLSCCLILDTSYSMRGKPINMLNKAVEKYFKDIEKKKRYKEKVETAIVTFGNSEFSTLTPENERDPRKGVKTLLDFWDINEGKVPTLSADEGGFTAMGEAVEVGLNIVLKRKEEYRKHVGSYDQPWLVIMTDGKPYDYNSSMESLGKYDGGSINDIASKTDEMVKNKKLQVILVLIGEDVDIDVLKKFSPLRWSEGKLIKNNPLKVNNLNFDKFFQFLTQTLGDPEGGFIDTDTDEYKDLEELLD